MLCSLHHPNIVRFYGMAVDTSPRRGASYYLVSDLKDTDLRKFVDSHPQPKQEEIFRLAIEICAPLEFLHSLNMVHRDLKPENILLDKQGTAFLCDFGVSKAIDDNTSTDMTTNLGTVAYMAPELGNLRRFALDQVGTSDEDYNMAKAPDGVTKLIARQKSDYAKENLTMSPRTERTQSLLEASNSMLQLSVEGAGKLDCYSYAIVLWVLLSWQLPFRTLSPMQIMIAVAYHNKRPSTRDFAARWPPAVIELMRRMWSADPSDRPTIAACKTDLALIRDEFAQNASEQVTDANAETLPPPTSPTPTRDSTDGDGNHIKE